MMIDLQPATSRPNPHPKRNYTVTARVLAANRANLALANAVPREIRFRSTERRRQACYRNLKQALIAKKRDRSLYYATSFHHGWYVADPERALDLVGATPEEYHRHLEAWRREIAPRDAAERKLARAMGMLSWRWIAGVRLECDLEALATFRLLEGLAAERRPDGPGAAPLPVAWDQLSLLGLRLSGVLGGYDALLAPLESIRHRLLRLWQELLRGRGEPLIDPSEVGCPAHSQPVVVDYEAHSPFVLADPFASCDRTEAACRPGPKELLAVEQWTDVPSPAGSGESSGAYITGPGVAGSDSQDAPGPPPASSGGPVSPEPVADRLQAYQRQLRASGLEMLREARRLGRDLPGSFDSFLRRVQAALGEPCAAALDPAARRWDRRVRLFARAVWNSLRALEDHAGDLLSWLNARLGDYKHSFRPKPWLGSLFAGIRSTRRLKELKSGQAGKPVQDCERGEVLMDFYYELRMKFWDRMQRLRLRCRAAVEVMRRTGIGVGSRE